jgi:hypothetical protein
MFNGTLVPSTSTRKHSLKRYGLDKMTARACEIAPVLVNATIDLACGNKLQLNTCYRRK